MGDRNRPVEKYPESGYLSCRKCGFQFNTFQRPYSSIQPGDGVSSQPYTQLDGAVTAGDTSITVDSTSRFRTPATGSITAFAAVGAYKTKVTDASHGLKGGQIIISSTTNYDGTFYIEDVLTNTFVITIPYVADDATGTWIKPEVIMIYDTAVISSTDQARANEVKYTGKAATTFTGCLGMLAHADDMYVRGNPASRAGCPLCGVYN